MKELWIRWLLIRGFFKLVANPERTELIFEAIRLLAKSKDQGPTKVIVDGAKADPTFREMFNSGYMPLKPQLADLGRLPEGTFGRAVHDHMKKNNIDFELFPDEDVHLPIEYVSQRMYLDHDLWHVLLNYNTDIADELALQAFNVAQLRSPFGALIISGGLLNLLRKDPMSAADAIGRVSEGYQRGKKSKFLLGLRLHEMFDRPLTEVRALAQI